MGKGGEVFVLDMGKPVSIVKLAEDLIKLNGMEPYSDIKIDFVGLRPGEKLFEELLTAEEGTTSTEHDKIFIASNCTKFQEGEMSVMIERLCRIIQERQLSVQEFMTAFVPFYQP